MRNSLAALAVLLFTPAVASAQAPTLTDQVRQFVSVDAPVVALTHVRVIDGTGAPARDDQTIIIDGGVIRAVGGAASVAIPAGAKVIDAAGKSVMPGFVMMHEHMFYPSGGGTVYNEQAFSFPRLYLAGGVTSARTAGNMAGYADLELKHAIDSGRAVGPWLDATAPYLNGPACRFIRCMRSPDPPMRRRWSRTGLIAARRHSRRTCTFAATSSRPR
jgi:enamidase